MKRKLLAFWGRALWAFLLVVLGLLPFSPPFSNRRSGGYGNGVDQQ